MKHILNGKSYTSLSSCYNDNSEKITVGIATVRSRLKSGWSLEDALFKPKEKTLETKLGDHTVEGKVYKNLPSISKEYGITLNTIYKRYSRGCRGDDLIPLKKRKNYIEVIEDKKYGFYAGNIGYVTAADACKKLGVKYVTYQSRRRRGLSIEQALEIEAVVDGRVAKGALHLVNGDSKTIDELSQIYNVPLSTIRDRLKRGASIRQALNLDEIPIGSLERQRDVKTKKRELIRLEVDGKIFKSYKSLADAYDLPDYTVRQRIVDYGYSAEDAVKIDGKNKAVVIDGVSYESNTAAAEAFGITAEILYARLDKGFTLREALQLDTRENSWTITYQDKIYKSLPQLAKAVGIPASTLRRRIIQGMSLEEAINAGERTINAGRYNLTILERDNELAEKPAYLYFVAIVINDKKRFKIGITTQTVDMRLGQQYEFETIKTIKGTLKNCFLLEQDIISLLSGKKDPEITSDMLDGYSEIFILDSNDILYVNEILEDAINEKALP